MECDCEKSHNGLGISGRLCDCQDGTVNVKWKFKTDYGIDISGSIRVNENVAEQVIIQMNNIYGEGTHWIEDN